LGTSPRWITTNGNGKEETERTGRIAYDFGVERLRSFLNGWKLAQQSEKTFRYDYFAELEKLYKRIFPGRSFAGVELMPGVDTPTQSDFYFLLNDGHRTYDLVEMSAGEQSIFPILYEFVRLQITHSVVLVDEVDLNLHPTGAQLVVSQLPKIAPNCQFILTTHSEAVSNVISEDETFHLPGGSLCL
jgi:predicted ATPase